MGLISRVSSRTYRKPTMAIQYQFAAGVLYCEVAVVILLCLPFISNRFWNRIFKWKFLKTIGENFGSHVFLVIASILGLLFFDSINSMAKYEKQSEDADEQGKVIIGHDPHSSKFRAQRNFYITMSAFVFWIVLRRLVTVISQAAQYEIRSEAMEKQAKSASDMASQLMDNKEEDDSEGTSELKKEVKKLNVKLSEAVIAKEKAEEDLAVVKEQAKANNREYDRLMGELEKAQASGDKKDS